MKLTKEQEAIVDTVKSVDGIIAVNAVAGSGKSSTCRAVVESMRPRNGMYTAYNKGIVEDSKNKMGNFIDCRTMHSLAYKYYRPSGKISDLKYSDIKEPLDYNEKQQIIDLLNDYYISEFLTIEGYVYSDPHIEYEIDERLIKLAKRYDELISNCKVHPTFNSMLKWFHRKLAMGMQVGFDMLVLDETQDVSSVTLEIFKLIKSPKKLILGDKYQNIYSSFLKTVNAFELLDIDEILPLTKSFRCNPDVAGAVEEFGKMFLCKSFRFEGTENDGDDKEAYITRTNSAMIEVMYDLLQEGKTFSTIRSINEIFELPIAIIMANKPDSNAMSRQHRYIFDAYKQAFGNKKIKQNQWFEYLEENMSENMTVMSAIKLLRKLNKREVSLFEVKDKVREMDPNPIRILSTAHAFKGLEANRVYINNDLNVALEIAKKKRYECDSDEEDNTVKEEFNVYYVAMSRAKRELM